MLAKTRYVIFARVVLHLGLSLDLPLIELVLAATRSTDVAFSHWRSLLVRSLLQWQATFSPWSEALSSSGSHIQFAWMPSLSTLSKWSFPHMTTNKETKVRIPTCGIAIPGQHSIQGFSPHRWSPSRRLGIPSPPRQGAEGEAPLWLPGAASSFWLMLFPSYWIYLFLLCDVEPLEAPL